MGQVCQKNLYKIDPNYFVSIIMINYILNQIMMSSCQEAFILSPKQHPSKSISFYMQSKKETQGGKIR